MPSTGNILDVAQGGKNDRDDCIGVLPCSVEVEKESQANAGSTRRSLSPNTEEVCPDHAQTARQNDSGLCVRQLRKDGQIDVVDLDAGNAPVKDSPLVGDEGVSSAQANPQGSSDSQINQGLTIERLIDSAIRAEEHAAEIEQLRAEENDAAEECALIEASGYNDPKFESNGRY